MPCYGICKIAQLQCRFLRPRGTLRQLISVRMMATHAERQKATVRCKDDQDNVTISLLLAGRWRHLNRPKSEPLEKPLGRIRANVAPAPNKKDKKKKKPTIEEQSAVAAPEVFIGLFDTADGASNPLDGTLPNEQAWRMAKLLQVGEVLYDIEFNPPTVERVLVQRWPMVGFPVLAQATVAFAELEASRWRWLRSKSGKEWEDIGTTGPMYTPMDQDVGCLLRAECTPVRATARKDPLSTPTSDSEVEEGESAYSDTGPVQAAPALTAAQLRCPAGPLAPTLSPAFRIMSYNILADQYASTDYAQKVLFNYCPLELLSVDYRHQLILQELHHYAADIICLQEVDESMFNQLLVPHMSLQGYAAHYTNKCGKVREGSATFYRESRYKLLACKGVLLRDLFVDPLPSHLAVFQPLLDASPALRIALQKVGTIAQVSLLAPTDSAHPSEKPVCVINTHLFFHPMASHIRNMHSYAIMVEALAFLEAHTGTPATSPEAAASIIFVGDFNSDLNDGIPGVVELLSRGKLPGTYWDWAHGAPFSWGKEDEEQEGEHRIEGDSKAEAAAVASIAVTGVDLELPVAMRAADDLRTPFTNYTDGFIALLDYVWYNPRLLTATSSVPQPAEAHVSSFLPSPVFPSDHLAVVYDFLWEPDSSTVSVSDSSIPVPQGESILPQVVAALKQSEVVALPTDTIYGLAADASSAGGVMRIYGIKNRNLGVPLAICVADAADVPRYGDSAHLPDGLLSDFLPGPYTVLLPRKADSTLCVQLNPGVKSIGIRVPNHDFIRSVCREFGGAIALTSANVSGTGSTLAVEEFQDLWNKCGVVVDGGRIDGSTRKGSTVLDLSQPGKFKIIRAGDGCDRALDLLKNKYKLSDLAGL